MDRGTVKSLERLQRILADLRLCRSFNECKIKVSARIKVGMLWVFYVVILMVVCSLALAKSEVENKIRFDSVEVLSKTKTQAESRVKLVRSLLEDGEIEEKDLRKIRSLYEDARADVNAGLDRLLVEIEATGSHGSMDPYKRVAERAAKRVAEFVEASDELILGEDRSGIVAASLELADSMMKAFVDVWKTLRGERSQRSALLTQRIESLKWGQFDEIK